MQKETVSTAPAAATASPDWLAIRQQFPTTEKLTFLNSGMKVILPRCVGDAMQEWIDDVYDTGGETAFAMAEIEETRAVVASTFGAPKDCISLIKNTSEGVDIIAQGFPWRPATMLLSATSNMRTIPSLALPRIAERGNTLCKPDEQGHITLDCYRPLVDKRTRILALAWVAYGNGYRAELPELGAFCRERGVELIVDGIQGIGVLASPINELGVDAMIAGGHKAQLSLTGAGFMYATPKLRSIVVPAYAAKFSFTSNDRFQPKLELAMDGHRSSTGTLISSAAMFNAAQPSSSAASVSPTSRHACETSLRD